VTGAVFFDFNGVLVDDEAQHCHALQAVLHDEGIILSREEYYAHYLGVDDRAGFVQAYRRANRTLTSAQLQRLVEAKSQLYQRLIRTSLEIVAGAAEFVRAAAERFRLAIVSGALREEVELGLTRTGFADRFETIITADDISRCKPEDSLPGLAAARAAGMACVMLTTSHSTRTLRDSGATLVWDSFVGHSPAELADL